MLIAHCPVPIDCSPHLVVLDKSHIESKSGSTLKKNTVEQMLTLNLFWQLAGFGVWYFLHFWYCPSCHHGIGQSISDPSACWHCWFCALWTCLGNRADEVRPFHKLNPKELFSKKISRTENEERPGITSPAPSSPYARCGGTCADIPFHFSLQINQILQT